MPRILNYHAPVKLLDGLPQTSLEPLVAFYPVEEMERVFYIKMHLFVPDGVVPILNADIDIIKTEETEAGDLSLRQIAIMRDKAPLPDIDTYALWQLDIQMQLEADEPVAQGLRVKYVIGDPRTTRGTVTTVATT